MEGDGQEIGVPESESMTFAKRLPLDRLQQRLRCWEAGLQPEKHTYVSRAVIFYQVKCFAAGGRESANSKA